MNVDYYADLAQKSRNSGDTDNATVHYHLEIAKGRKKEEANPLRAEWGKTRLKVDLPEPDAAIWREIVRPEFDLALLPAYSFTLQFTFTLAQPYISKDDNGFYIIDNPIVRDKVFHLPMVRPSSWKGNLYAALWQLGYRKEKKDDPTKRLFGETRNDDSGQAGRLIFYPTFFTQTSLEIINPHDRKTKVGKNPILFESVPVGATGTFTLLYVPFDRIGEIAAGTRKQAVEDMCLLAEGLQAMFRTYGFSAKRTSGFGVVKEAVSDGKVTIRAVEAVKPTSEQVVTRPTIQLARYLVAPGQLKSEYLNAGGTFRERSATELQTLGKSARQEFDKAKKWWEREGKALAAQLPAPIEPAQIAPTARPVEWLARDFSSFEALVARAKEIAGLLTTGGAE